MIEYQKIKRMNYIKNLKSKKSKVRNFLLMKHIIYRENDFYKIKITLNKFGYLYCFIKSVLCFLTILIFIIPFTLWVGIKEVFQDFEGFVQSFNFIETFKDIKRDLEYEVTVKKDLEAINTVKKEMSIIESNWSVQNEKTR